MITYLTFFLGLVLGPQTIELAVAPEVASVEIRLNGQPVGALSSEPWRLPIDFGTALLPQKLTATAFDAEGRKLEVSQQWVNLPRSPAAVAVVLERGPDGVPTGARLSWESVYGDQPLAVGATFDGKPLEALPDRRLLLPHHDLEQIHLLRVEVSFTETVSALSELAWGGAFEDEVSTELTSVAVRLAPHSELPDVADLQGWLASEGLPLEVVAVEKGHAEAVVVRDEDALDSLARLQRRAADLLRIGVRANENRSHLRAALPLAEDQGLRFIWPFPSWQESRSTRFALFPSTLEFSSREAGVYWLLQGVRLARKPETAQRLSEAVVVAGLSASNRARRRAVVLVLGRRAEDHSALPPIEARRYLSALSVPLLVWSLDRASDHEAAWGEVVDVSTLARLGQAVEDLRNDLERQRIVWVRGTHLPQHIRLTSAARGVELVR
ncbi:MAG TPA: hypothetical protein VF017_14295 [Thermoanaerobaculia bacterium]|nr:hypothetical protein [Thermoanaerobaculia bacterium]